MSTPANLSDQIVALPDGAGAVRSLGETFAPDPQTGVGRFAIPLPLPAGPAGLRPTLTLSYATVAGNGPAGLGWQVDLAQVVRRTDHGIPTYDDQYDRFAIQGDELLPQGGSAYRFRVERRFARVRRLVEQGQDAWLVTEPNGLRTFYGEVAGARLAAGGRVAAWFITRQQDVHGNEITYTYGGEPASGDVRLQSISWGGGHRVRVEWEARPDPVVSCRTGFPTRSTARIRELALEVERGDTGLYHCYRRHSLAYAVSSWTGRSLLVSVTATGVAADGAERALPPLRFTYQDGDPARGAWHPIVGDRPNRSLAARDVTLVRQSGSGLPDVFETRATGHYLRVNLGRGRFGPATRVSAPPHVTLSQPGTFLSDLDGDGFADLVVAGGRHVYPGVPKGGGWGPALTSTLAPSVDLDARDVRLVDLTGSGRPDVLRSGADGWAFFENLGGGRFAPAASAGPAPPLSLADPRVHLADIDGDGLADLVHVDGTGITVWRSCGRGHFGPPQRMPGAPQLGAGLDPASVRLVDLTGSGQADLVITRAGVVHVAFNQAGVRWRPLVEVARGPLSSQGFVEVTDVLGTGAEGLLYTDQGGEWRFRELFPGQVDLLVTITNGLGATTHVTHASSAAHWARDLADGRPWRTAMPMPTAVVDRVTTTDQVSGTTVAMAYRYAHGTYDGREREFRGFARVSQTDREAPADDPEPIAQAHVVRWYHVGSTPDLRDEWHPVPGDPLLDDIPAHPWARRATAGLLRREEIYALDGDERPFQVVESACRVFAVGRTSARLTSAYAPVVVRQRRSYFERAPEPRQVEAFTVFDLHAGAGYGLPVEVRERGHGRRGPLSTPHERAQQTLLERITRTAYVHLDMAEHHDPMGADPPSYVVGNAATVERYAVTPTGEVLLGRTRLFYDGADYQGLGYPGSGSAPAVTHGRLASRLEWVFSASAFAAMFPANSGAAAARDGAGHYLQDGGEYYARAQRQRYQANGQVTGRLTPAGHESLIEYDARHGIYPIATVDAAGHPLLFERHVLPFLVAATVDANGNRIQYTYDATTALAARTVMGTLGPDGWEGDPPSHPTESYDYDFSTVPLRVTARTRHVRMGATFDVHRFVDGLGRIIQERQTAEPAAEAPLVPRFRVTGWQLFNHKGLAVRHYLPVFASSPDYRPGDATTPRTETCFDAVGRVVRVTHPDGTVDTTVYQPWEQVLADRNDNAAQVPATDTRYGAVLERIASHAGTVTRRYHDALGRAIAVGEDNGDGIHVTQTVLDLADRVVAVLDARGLDEATWYFTFDRMGRAVSTTHTTAAGTHYSLADAGGSVIWTRDALGTEVTFTHDPLGRVLTETSWVSGVAALRRFNRYPSYDPRDPGHPALQGRNLYGRLAEARAADGIREYTYDWRGLPVQVAHRFWSYRDAAGRPWHDPQSTLWTSGAGTEPAIPADPAPALTDFLELPDVSTGQALVVTTRYDAAARPVEVRYPGGVRSEARYNAAGLVDAVTVDRGVPGEGPLAVVTRCDYDARGQLITITHGNGVRTERTFDPALARMVALFSQRIDPSTGARVDFQDLTYTYDPVGNPHAIVDHLATASYSHNRVVPNTRTFRYDPRYRLVEATGRRHRLATYAVPDVLAPAPSRADYEAYTHTYAYDAVGNLTGNGEYSAGPLAYKVGRIDLFNGDATEAGAFTAPDEGNYRYDGNGAVTHTPRHHLLAYGHNRLLRYVDLGGGGQVRYRHHDSARVVRLVHKPGVTALTVYLGPFEYHWRRGATTFSKFVLHVSAHGRHAQVERVAAGHDPDSLPIFFHHADHLGSGHVLTTATGDLLSQEEYFAYGRPSDRRDARNRYRYIGVERDEDTQLHMTGPRQYDSVSGRFLQPDPIATVTPGWSPYVYASGSPVGRLDASGFADKVVGPTPPKPGRLPPKTEEEAAQAAARLRPDTQPVQDRGIQGPSRTLAPQPGASMEGLIAPTTAPVTTPAADPERLRAEASGRAPEPLRPWDAPGEVNPAILEQMEIEHARDQARRPMDDYEIGPDDPTDHGAGPSGSSGGPAGGGPHGSPGGAPPPSAGRSVLREAAEESGEWASRRVAKKAFSFVPLGGLVGESLFAEPDQTWSETLVRGVGGELGVGPIDATTVVDVLVDYGPWQYEEAWQPACTAGCHYGTP